MPNNNHALQRTRRERRGCKSTRPVGRVDEFGSFGNQMTRFLSISVVSGVAIIAASSLYAARPVLHITDETPLWLTEYDASRQATSYPGPGTPLAQLKAGDQLRLLWTTQGKDYRAYLVIGQHLQRGWVLYGQRGFAHL